MKAPFRLLLLWLLPSLQALGWAQASSPKPLAQMPASARQLIAIKVTGSKRFPEAEIAASTGLQMGAVVGDDDFKKAARRLGDTGAFTDIGYTFSYSSAGTKLELHVTDAEKFLPARFEDFVWFSDAELRGRIKEHVPMFHGELPFFGRMADEVSDVLQAMLVERAIPGHVTYQRYAKKDGPIEAFSYVVEDVLIRVGNIDFTGAGSSESSALEAVARRLGESEYSRSRFEAFAQRQVLPVYYARGYLKAAVGEPQPKVVKLPGADAGPANGEGPRNQTVVDVTFAVTPGQQYKLKTIDWSGNHQFPTDALQKMVLVQPGQPANTVRLAENLREVQKLYGSRGFINASIKANAEFDDVVSTVAMHLEVKEDSVYHMGDLEFRGLDNSLTAKLRNAWKIRAGEVYDASYLDEYLTEAHKLLSANLDWDVASHVTANVRSKTVDVDIIYTVKAPK